MTDPSSHLQTSLGIAGTGLALLGGAVLVSLVICGGGLGGAIYDRLPELVVGDRAVPIPATPPRLPEVGVGLQAPDDQLAEADPRTRTRRQPVKTHATAADVARWTTPSEPDDVASPLAAASFVEPGPEDMVPPTPLTVAAPEPLAPAPSAPSETPTVTPAPIPPPAPQGPVAYVGLAGDAQGVWASSADGRMQRLPSNLPPGKYDILVTFPGGEPFAATTLLILDTTPRTITCRASLALCKVR